MFAEEEVELKDQIIQNLENCGFLTKIKAELRAGVFLALEEEGILKSRNPLSNKKFEDYFQTDEGKLTVSVIREFLEFFELKYTLSVFDPEISSKTPCASRSDLCDRFNLISHETDVPVLSAIIKSVTPVDQGRKNDEDSLSSISVDANEMKNYTFSNEQPVSAQAIKDIFNIQTKETVGDDHDPFFDDPLPTEKPNYFTQLDEGKKITSDSLLIEKQAFSDSKDDYLNANSLSSLKNLPSLTAKNTQSTDWTFSKGPKNTLSSLDMPTSISKIDNNNMNADEENFESLSKTNSDKGESVDGGSEKQIISEESIEEELEEDLSAVEDLLNSSLSIGDDGTTDQTVSQISVGNCDHVEQCDSLS